MTTAPCGAHCVTWPANSRRIVGLIVALCAGLSGHGYKFAPLLGEVLADLALEGETGHGIAFLDPGRFA